MTIFVVKFWSTSCGICGRMSKYDTKVAEELGLGFISVQRSKVETYERFKYVAAQLYPDLRMGWPTYIIAKGDDLSKLVVIGQVRGGSDKGTFRKKIQDVINADNPTQQPAKELPNTHVWGESLPGSPVTADETLPSGDGCPLKGPDNEKGTKIGQWTDVFNALDCTYKYSTCLKDGNIKECKDTWERGKFQQSITGGGGGGSGGGAETQHLYDLVEKGSGGGDGGGGDGGGGGGCGDKSWSVRIEGYQGKKDAGSPLSLTGKASGVKDSDLTWKWYIGSDKQADGQTYNGIYPACGTSVTLRCQAEDKDCSHKEDSNQNVESNACGGGGGPTDPCDGVVCPGGQHCENGVCVPDGGGGHTNPCEPNPCGFGEMCIITGNDPGDYICMPNDPCFGVSCGPCEVCSNGSCVSTCLPGQICEGGVCKDPDPVDPCDGVTCGDCEICVNGACESTCAPGQICEGGVCKDPPPVDPCDGVVCPPNEECVNGICVPIDPCKDVVCPPNEECVNGICVPIDPCKDVVCRADQVCNNGVCECPPGQIEIGGVCQVPGCISDGDCGPCEKCENNSCVSTCRADQICDGSGVCICPPGTIEVNGVCTAGNCVDDSQCGDCESCVGNQCTSNCRADQVCENDVCICPPGTIEVNGVCVAGNCIDDSQCGDCESCVGNQCTNNCRADQVCVGDVCQCPPDHIEVNGVCVPGNCIDDSQCGDCESCVGNQCTNNCRADQVCVNDVCQCPPDHVEVNGLCVPGNCVDDSQCGDCESCIGNQCTNNCRADQICVDDVCECPPGFIECNGQCVEQPPCCDPLTEIEVDGKCEPNPCWGVECPDGEICEDGNCVPDPCKDVECPDGEICVDGDCKTDPCYGIECPPGYICECGECIPDRCWECCEDMKQCSHDCEDCHECYEDNCYIDLRMKISGPDCWPQGAEIKLTGTCLHAKDEKVNFTWYKGPRDNGGVKIAEGLGVNNITATAPTNPNDCIVYELYGEIEALNCPVPYDTHKLCVCENFPECPPATSTGRREPKRKNEEVFGKTHQNPIEIFPNMIPSTLSFKGRI